MPFKPKKISAYDAMYEAQQTAIDQSGWGYAPKLVKPRNFTFWAMAFLLLLGFANWYVDTQDAIAAFPTELAQGVAYFVC